jgi:hypothetical protein
VVGDKSGGYTTLRLTETPELLNRLRAMLPLQLALIHVVRNPFDNIATLFRRGSFPSLERAIAFYDELCQTVARLETRGEPGTLHRIHHEQLLQTPREHLAALCMHLGLSAPDEWLEAGAEVVSASSLKVALELDWDDPQARQQALGQPMAARSCGGAWPQRAASRLRTPRCDTGARVGGSASIATSGTCCAT